ncbi:MAG: hypothetical protein KAI29_13660 [Cyclobacteriaceae bacterium]|nr:hypothetical protein [Cyclobacteriaceae bacterium]
MKIGILFLVLFVLTLESTAQTCCTGGVPYLGAFKIPVVSSGQFSLNFSYGLNKNADLLLQDEEISDNSSQRIVQTILLQSDYGLNENISFSVVIPYLFQKEQINFLSNNHQLLNNGFGDLSLWSNYKRELGLHNVAASIALKVPSGKTDAVDPENGIEYPFSFQNGSGSWDFIFNVYDEIPLDKKRVVTWVNQISAKINTKGNKFVAHPGYRFGHTFQYFSSISVHWVMGKFLANSFVGFSYQKKMKDEFDGGFENENTGGNWIYANIGYNHQFNPKLMIGISGSLPIYRSINGLQLTTDKQANIIIGYII